MASQPTGGGNLLTLKVLFLKEPHSAKAISSNSGGIWIESLDLAASIQRAAPAVGHAAVPPEDQFTKATEATNPLLFVPFSQIEWMLAYSPF
jgi:hypothetical protein